MADSSQSDKRERICGSVEACKPDEFCWCRTNDVPSPEELQALRTDRRSLNAMATLLANARRERDSAVAQLAMQSAEAQVNAAPPGYEAAGDGKAEVPDIIQSKGTPASAAPSSEGTIAEASPGVDDEFLRWWHQQEARAVSWLVPHAFNAIARAALAAWRARSATAPRTLPDYSALYHELLMEVQMKHPTMSRHEQAKQIIRAHHNQDHGPSRAAPMDSTGAKKK